MNSAQPFDKQALTRIYEQNRPELFRYASQLLDDSNLIEECVSETFSRFLQSNRGGARPENVQDYLHRAAQTWILDRHRRKPFVESSLDDRLGADPEDNPVNMVSKEMDRQRVRAAIMLLPAAQRQVIVLKYLQEQSYEDIAAAIGKDIETVHALQRRAVYALRHMLAE